MPNIDRKVLSVGIDFRNLNITAPYNLSWRLYKTIHKHLLTFQTPEPPTSAGVSMIGIFIQHTNDKLFRTLLIKFNNICVLTRCEQCHLNES